MTHWRLVLGLGYLGRLGKLTSESLSIFKIRFEFAVIEESKIEVKIEANVGVEVKAEVKIDVVVKIEVNVRVNVRAKILEKRRGIKLKHPVA